MNEEWQQLASNAITHAASMCQESFRQTLSEYERPSVLYKPKLSKDGDQWCAMYGENMQEGCCGFGVSPAQAMRDFDLNWYR